MTRNDARLQPRPTQVSVSRQDAPSLKGDDAAIDACACRAVSETGAAALVDATEGVLSQADDSQAIN